MQYMNCPQCGQQQKESQLLHGACSFCMAMIQKPEQTTAPAEQSTVRDSAVRVLNSGRINLKLDNAHAYLMLHKTFMTPLSLAVGFWLLAGLFISYSSVSGNSPPGSRIYCEQHLGTEPQKILTFKESNQGLNFIWQGAPLQQSHCVIKLRHMHPLLFWADKTVRFPLARLREIKTIERVGSEGDSYYYLRLVIAGQKAIDIASSDIEVVVEHKLHLVANAFMDYEPEIEFSFRDYLYIVIIIGTSYVPVLLWLVFFIAARRNPLCNHLIWDFDKTKGQMKQVRFGPLGIPSEKIYQLKQIKSIDYVLQDEEKNAWVYMLNFKNLKPVKMGPFKESQKARQSPDALRRALLKWLDLRA